MATIFKDVGSVTYNDNGGLRVTLTNEVAGAIEIPDNLGSVTIDLAGRNLVGADGADGDATTAGGNGQPVIHIVASGEDGEPTEITIINSGETGGTVAGGKGGAGNPPGNGSAAIAVADDVKDGTQVNIGEGVTVVGGAGGEDATGTDIGGKGGVGVDGDVGTNDGTISGGAGGASVNGTPGVNGVAVTGEVGGGKGSATKAVVPVPVLSDKVYSGEALKADIPETELYAVAVNDARTDVGTNKVTLVLNDTTRYCWADAASSSVSVPFAIVPAPITAASVAVIAEQTYAGAAIEPIPTVTDMRTLTGATKPTNIIGVGDYDVSYLDNVEAGTAKVVLKGKRNYVGEVTNEFTIAQAANVWTAEPSVADKVYDGSPAAVSVGTAKFGTPVVTYDGGLAFAPTAPGVHTATFTVAATKNYAGLSTTLPYTIVSVEEDTLEKLFDGIGAVASDSSGNITVTLTNEVAGVIEIPDNLGFVTVDLVGHDLVGADGADGNATTAGGNGQPAIRIVASGAEGTATTLTIVNSGEIGGMVTGGKGGAGNPPGNGSAAVEVADDAKSGTKVNIGEGVTVIGGAGGDDATGTGTGGRGGAGIVGDVGTNDGTISGGAGGTSENGIPGVNGVAVTGEVGGGKGSATKAVVPVPVLSDKVYSGEALKADIPETELYAVAVNDARTEVGTNKVTLVLNDTTRYCWAEGTAPFVNVPFAVVPASITETMVSSVEPQAFLGAPVEPEIVVAFGARNLVRDTDYSLVYENNDADGLVGRAVVTGLGNFTGSFVRSFAIGRIDRVAEFVETDLAADENSNVTVRVFGGNIDRSSSVKVYLKYTGTAAADLDLGKTLVNGEPVNAKTFKFPVTLKWAAGEVDEKTITLKAKKDALTEGPEFLTLQLGGELGMVLGEARTCTVRINDLSANPLKASAKNPSKTKGVKKFAVTTLSADETMGLVSPSNSWYKGAKLTVKAVAKTGYAFAGWYDLATGKKVSTSANYTFTVAKAVTLEARFAKRYYVRALADPVDGATVTGGGWFAKGKTATLKAVTKAHFKFLGWFAADADDINVAGTNKLSGSLTYKPVVTNDMTIYARFQSEPRLEIFNGNSKGGSVKGANKYAAGKAVKLTATPKKDYAFVGWTDFDGNRLSSATTYTYKMAADGVVIRANFVKESQLLTPALNWTATNLTVGVMYSVAPKAFGAEATASSGVDGAAAVKVVSVTGLPKGLAWKSGKVTGVPTAAGVKTVSVKVALATNAKKTWTVKHTLVVEALPTWAKGTFVGGAENCAATLTVGATGKVSGKVCFANAVWTFSAASYAGGSATGGVFTVKATATKGKTQKVVTIVVGEDALGGWAASETAGFAFEARQNRWKADEVWQEWATALQGRELAAADTAGNPCIVSVLLNGQVSGVLTVGKDKFAGTATLVPMTDEDGRPNGWCRAWLYFASNAKKKFKGAIVPVLVRQ